MARPLAAPANSGAAPANSATRAMGLEDRTSENIERIRALTAARDYVAARLKPLESASQHLQRLQPATSGKVLLIRDPGRTHGDRESVRNPSRFIAWLLAASGVKPRAAPNPNQFHPGLFACYQAAAQGIAVSGERAGQPVVRLAFSGASSEPVSNDKGGKTEEQPVAEALGVSVYAKQRVHGHDRAQLERLCRYVMRPPLSQDRLERRVDGTPPGVPMRPRLELTLKNVWKDGHPRAPARAP